MIKRCLPVPLGADGHLLKINNNIRNAIRKNNIWFFVDLSIRGGYNEIKEVI